MTCSHETTYQHWVVEEDWQTGETSGRWKSTTRSTCEDIDLHRYRCTKCNQVMYYSARAQECYEKGIPDDILGI